MPDFVHPLWLVIGVLLVPALWWLHRMRMALRERIVAALFLWPERSANANAGATRQRAERRWPLRAAVAASICIALAAPLWPDAADHTVWLDESPSMYATDGSRMDQALAQLQRELGAAGIDRFVLRSVQRDQSLRLRTDTDWRVEARNWSRAVAQPSTQVDVAADNDWLVSDGITPALRRWATRQSFARVIQPAGVAPNSAVTRIAARRALHDETLLDVHIGVEHAGSSTTAGTLTLSDGRAVLATEVLAGDTRRQDLVFTVPTTTQGPLVAALSVTDALVDDNRLVLPAFVSSSGVHVDEQCPRWLVVAVDAHPGLQRVASGAASLVCVPDASTRGPALRLHDGQALPGTPAPAWHRHAGDAQRLPLDANWRALRDAPPTDEQTLLSAAQHSLVRLDGEVLDVWIDFSAASPPVNALLIAVLLERLIPQAQPGHVWQAQNANGADLTARPIEPVTRAASGPVVANNTPRLMLLAAALALVLVDLLIRGREQGKQI